MIMLNQGYKPLVEVPRSSDRMAVVIQEILQDKIYLDTSGQVPAARRGGFRRRRRHPPGDDGGHLHRPGRRRRLTTLRILDFGFSIERGLAFAVGSDNPKSKIENPKSREEMHHGRTPRSFTPDERADFPTS